ncbi:MAG: efflux RND transporter periplasmic adaptor subunit [Phycisphaerales bacterium]|nr:efflux RND transporter periplasmic adaptor subunit [Phycisphaerales bacterium]
MRTFFVVMAVLLGIALAGFVVVGPAALEYIPSFSGTAHEAAVRTAKVEERSVVETVSAPGELEPLIKVEVSAEVSARVLELPKREGDLVQAGDVLLKLDDRDLQAALNAQIARREAEKFRLRSEEKRLAGPQSTLANASATLERQQSLFETGDISRQQLDDAIARVRELQSTVAASSENISVIEQSLAAADADIQRQREMLRRTTIIAPIAGQVTLLNAEVGELVVVGTMNNPGTKIMTVADLTTVRLKAKVSESDIARIAIGQSAIIRVNAYRGREFRGTVDKVALSRSSESGLASSGSSGTGFFKAEVAIDLEPGETLLSGLAANVDIKVAEHHGLVVPSQAIIEKSVDDLPPSLRESPFVDAVRRTCAIVYLVVDGVVHVTPVKSGPSSLVDTIVLEGVSAGAVVIIGPFKVLEKLKDGEVVIDERDVEKAKSAVEGTSKKSGVQVKMSRAGALEKVCACA